MDMNQAVRDLASYRQELEVIRLAVKQRQDRLEATPEWADLQRGKEKQAAAQDVVSETEGQLRTLAVGQYVANQDKHPHPAITIKEYDVMAYDQDEAKLYSLEHLPHALKLDKTAFEKAAKGIPLDFVTRGKEYRATIATDLSEWVA